MCTHSHKACCCAGCVQIFCENNSRVGASRVRIRGTTPCLAASCATPLPARAPARTRRARAGVGKSTVAVNLAYTLAQMGARVGIFDADVYGPSLPTMVSPAVRVLRMDPVTRALEPTEYEGVKLVSFGFAGQGSAIMRGPMVSGALAARPFCSPCRLGVAHAARAARSCAGPCLGCAAAQGPCGNSSNREWACAPHSVGRTELGNVAAERQVAGTCVLASMRVLIHAEGPVSRQAHARVSRRGCRGAPRGRRRAAPRRGRHRRTAADAARRAARGGARAPGAACGVACEAEALQARMRWGAQA